MKHKNWIVAGISGLALLSVLAAVVLCAWLMTAIMVKRLTPASPPADGPD